MRAVKQQVKRCCAFQAEPQRGLGGLFGRIASTLSMDGEDDGTGTSSARRWGSTVVNTLTGSPGYTPLASCPWLMHANPHGLLLCFLTTFLSTLLASGMLSHRHAKPCVVICC